MQQQHRLAVGRAGLDVAHPQAADVGVPWPVTEIGELGESVVRRPKHSHWLILAHRGRRWLAEVAR